MKINRKLILGLLLVMAGTLVFDLPILRHLKIQQAKPNFIFGAILFIIGVYFVYQGKKQQKEERESDG
jgi:small neutral amino acid transporter SnatA (MarC family)